MTPTDPTPLSAAEIEFRIRSFRDLAEETNPNVGDYAGMAREAVEVFDALTAENARLREGLDNNRQAYDGLSEQLRLEVERRMDNLRAQLATATEALKHYADERNWYDKRETGYGQIYDPVPSELTGWKDPFSATDVARTALAPTTAPTCEGVETCPRCDGQFHFDREPLLSHDAVLLCPDCFRAERGGATPEPLYPCDKCGDLRTKSEGGTTFSYCEECWGRPHPVEPPASDTTGGER